MRKDRGARGDARRIARGLRLCALAMVLLLCAIARGAGAEGLCAREAFVQRFTEACQALDLPNNVKWQREGASGVYTCALFPDAMISLSCKDGQALAAS